ncbi:MAG: peptide chain release factor N(5)-glutamine methyltransferase [Alphaproteobacteria bacterium]|nr:peptide chain release factor N(5)-glutamine methyltransferase [Alphaproteobacteria bacterium]
MPPDSIAGALLAARRRLALISDTAALDARLLLQATANVSHEDIIAEPERRLSAEALAQFEAFMTRRLAHEPVSRILGARDFYGRSFRLTPDVLDPRPDTETLIDAALALIRPRSRLLDLGTGSGIIAVTLLAERPDTTGLATDLSPEALAIARSNAERHGVLSRLQLRQGSWFAPVSGSFDLILCNPPYIPASDIPGLAADVRDYDPLAALTGGPDGLEAYRAIARHAAAHLNPDGHVLVEIGAGQADDVSALFAAAGFRNVKRFQDLGGHDRCLSLRLG